MYIHINLNRVVIDATEEINYVGRNATTGMKVLVKNKSEAIGIIGSDLVIRPLASSSLAADFYTVEEAIPVPVIPEDYEPGKYTYSNGEFELYEGTVPMDAEELTKEMNSLDKKVEEAVKAVFPEWEPNGYSYFAGEKVSYKDSFYRCIQNHTSQSDWAPDVAVSLWVEMSDPGEEWPEWKQPAGGHDAYNKGDKVSHSSKHWISSVDANVWEPGVYGWDEQ